ncbi:type I 3-dehydroquinate dehydratase [Ramlibacter sp. USB13]|uniref:3-dehydroquinate dehydratase n=1 Tax=Ramlibacter cellulosilyticus TaxID=2764187 RepID=A0A923SA42_9BURK|nr:type I 3-dehydroquinate dehydratase [Ramlibacter cellulosilyticus]MBC5782381.1 type I 3-dehydroquinate dehydratase [Ramlibacter cellulosilyticus]
MTLQALPILLRGQPLAGGRLPAVCAPLVARTRDALVQEAAAVAALRPDLLEWRADFFSALADTAEVLAAAHAVRQAAGGIPVLFTRRSQREGGQPIALDEPGVLALYEAVAASGTVDAMDFEMGNEAAHVAQVRALTRRHGLALVLSFHDFQRTPADAELDARFAQAQRLEADVAKVAVMPQSMDDVHRLLGATLRASTALPIPVVSMAMGGLGAVTRLAGGAFGSALTFAVGSAPSAPGQIPIADVRGTLAVLQRATSG